MDTFLEFWKGLHVWFTSTTEGVFTVGVLANAFFLFFLRIARKLPLLGKRITEALGERLGRDLAGATIANDTRVVVYWVGIRATTTTLYAVATASMGVLFGPSLVRSGGIWRWVFASAITYGVSQIVIGMAALRLAYEMTNGLRGGPIKQTMMRAFLDAAPSPEALQSLKEFGIRLTGRPAENQHSVPYEKPSPR